MTRAEAQSELNRLEPLESAAWTECLLVEAQYNDELKRLEAERQTIKEASDSHAQTARSVWLPLHKRRRQLEAYLEMI